MPQRDAIIAPELLAPAGGPSALRAAVANGADAVYLGLQDLNARRGAENFTIETLSEWTSYAHLRGVRVYLTANVVVLPEELARALEMVGASWAAGIDAVIVQDLGLLRLLRAVLPDVRVHASTQIDVHNEPSVAALARMGVSRVTLSRELSVAEIASLSEESDVELESFVHGSLCFCHSGQCLMSSMIGGRSANRGVCAQPCRLEYDLVAGDGSEARSPGRHLLSPADLAGITRLPDLVRTGVAALKIEGRMKSPEYVATVVRVYRSALDRAVEDPEDYRVTDAEWNLLSEAFSRGFTEGYLSDIRDDGMMSYSRPNNRGVPVGRVVAVEARLATVAFDRAVESGDTLEFWTSSGRQTQPAGTMRVAGRETAVAPAGVRADLRTEGGVRPGDRVFRVANAALLEAARRTFTGAEERRPTPVVFSVRLRRGQPATVTAEADGLTGSAEGAPVEAARTRTVSAEDVMQHVGRLGGTPYAASGWDLELDSDVGIGFSVLHALRREALERLDALRLAPWSGRDVVVPVLPVLSVPRRSADSVPELVVAVSRAVVGDAVLAAGADRVLLTVTSSDSPGTWPSRIEPLLPRVAHQSEVASILELAHGRPMTCGNLGLLAAHASDAGARASEAAVAADWGLNVVNAWSAAALADLGANMVWASPELSERQLAHLVRHSALPVGAVAYGRLELMVAEHCVLQAAGPCSHACLGCARRAGAWSLRDRKGYVFPVRTDAAGYSHVYNSVPLDLSRSLAELVATGVSALRLELHLEEPGDAARVVKTYRALIADAIAGRRMPSAPLVSPSTTGHFFRGLS